MLSSDTVVFICMLYIFFFKQKTAYEMRISDWSSDVCSSDLPSFKDEARKLLAEDGIKANVASIKRIFERFLTFGDGPSDAVMLDNAQWLDALEYIPFLRAVGQHFSVNRMLSFDSVKLRLDREQSLSFLEFNRSEEHTSELQSLMRNSYAVF